MTFVESIQTCFRKYATFSGRASRSEFWWWVLFGILGGLVTSIIPFINAIFSIALIIPNLAVTARRLHDTDRSGWWMLAPYGFMALAGVVAMTGSGTGTAVVGVIALIMVIVLIVWLATKGTEGDNDFGSDPLGPEAEEAVTE